MANRPQYLPLFAKAQLVLGAVAVLVVAVLYPARKSEADAYAAAPSCTAQSQDVTTCKRLVPAQLEQLNCPTDFRPLDSCELKLRVQDQVRFIRLQQASSKRLSAGTQITIELLGSLPTAVEIDSKLERDFGAPEKAIKSLLRALLLQVVLTAVAAAYLLVRRRRLAATSERAD